MAGGGAVDGGAQRERFQGADAVVLAGEPVEYRLTSVEAAVVLQLGQTQMEHGTAEVPAHALAGKHVVVQCPTQLHLHGILPDAAEFSDGRDDRPSGIDAVDVVAQSRSQGEYAAPCEPPPVDFTRDGMEQILRHMGSAPAAV